jgi:2-phospho-L-lactate guanylyltransferase
MTVWAVIPVKPLNRAKSRLEKVLSPDQRAALAEMLFRQVLSVALSSNRIGGALVISRDTRAIGIARDLGAKTIQESGQSDLNPALERATQVLTSWRASAMLILPADLPLIHVDDINAMVDAGRDGDSVVIATDRHEDGTNAMFVRPPGLIQYTYGKESYRKHVLQARAAGAKVTIYESERLQLDIDEPSDLEAYNEWVMAQSDMQSHLRPFLPITAS